MFKKILIANRGEIAVRIARTCREMGIRTVALYEAPDETSLHIRVADECVLFNAPRGFNDQEAILQVARDKGADAIHPGYGFLSENEDFIARCTAAGITFIGPPAEVVAQARAKIETIGMARDAGFNTVQNSATCQAAPDIGVLHADAERLGYPVIVKSCRGGRGRGERLVRTPEQLAEAVRRALAEGQVVYGDQQVFVEKAILSAHQIGVQIVGDNFGNLIHLGEREGSLLFGNQKIVEESPAPSLDEAQRARMWQAALELARLFQVRGVVTIEFVVDGQGQFYFTEIKPRIVTEHPLTETRARLDLVREQIRLAAGEPLGLTQADVQLQGWAMSCRINAQDPQRNFMPSPGRLRVRFPNGPETRTDSYVYSGCIVPAVYDPLIAKVTVWAPGRAACLARLQRALHEISFHGIATNAAFLHQLAHSPQMVNGDYTTETTSSIQTPGEPVPLRDLAIAAALRYLRSSEEGQPVTPDRVDNNWHRSARGLPE